MAKYEQMRELLIHILSYLADEEYQLDLWVRKTCVFDEQINFYHTKHEIVHFIFDDMVLDTNIDNLLGILFDTRMEIEAVRPVVNALDKCLNQLGNAPDEVFVTHQLWKDVVSSAKNAHKLLVATDPEASS